MSYENLLESAKRYQIAFRNCSTLGEQMMLRESFYNYVMEGFVRGGYLEEKKRVLPTMLSKAVRRWIADNETLDPARFPNGYNPDNPPRWPFSPDFGGWGDWVPGGQWGPGFHPGDPGPFWPGWGVIPAGNPWYFDPQEGWKHVTIPLPKPGTPPPSVDLPEMLRHRYIQILNEKLK